MFLLNFVSVKNESNYEGTTRNGDPYTIGRWHVRNILDGNIMVVQMFTADHQVLKDNPGKVISGELNIIAKEYKGKYYNELSLKKCVVDDSKTYNDVATSSVANVPPVQDSSANDPIGYTDSNDLPF